MADVCQNCVFVGTWPCSYCLRVMALIIFVLWQLPTLAMLRMQGMGGNGRRLCSYPGECYAELEFQKFGADSWAFLQLPCLEDLLGLGPTNRHFLSEFLTHMHGSFHKTIMMPNCKASWRIHLQQLILSFLILQNETPWPTFLALRNSQDL